MFVVKKKKKKKKTKLFGHADMNNFKLSETLYCSQMTLDWSVNCCSVLVNVNEDDRLWWRIESEVGEDVMITSWERANWVHNSGDCKNSFFFPLT